MKQYPALLKRLEKRAKACRYRPDLPAVLEITAGPDEDRLIEEYRARLIADNYDPALPVLVLRFPSEVNNTVTV